MQVLSEPRSRRQLPPLVLFLWVVLVLAVMWAGIVAVAWVVWNAL